MRGNAPFPIFRAWAVAAVLVAVGFGVANLVVPAESAFERQALDELATLDDAPPESTRIVIFGNSLMREATAHLPTFEDRLTQAGADVSVANLAAGGRRFVSYRRLLDDVLHADPDVIVLHSQIFRGDADGRESTLRNRLRAWQGAPDLLTPTPCPVFDDPEERLAELIDVVAGRLAPHRARFEEPAEFFADAHERGVQIYLLYIPRSAAVEAAVEGPTSAHYRRVRETFGPLPNVTINHELVGGSEDLYCDSAHLTPTGQQFLLDQLVPSFLDYLDQLEDS